ncbi:DUF349 domain-containing protein [Marinicella rhabdoformis]|uniref:DUF349 domain-containing protein n=1 Tax=Marinicella rhabdoformis TaxID=2580566 RepID=UPI0012AEDBB3|nr:DUF349 domain-containing protein [Marinicella rhabdoformis]
MSIFNWFNKPKWQSPNEQVRLTAVQTDNDAALLDALPQIISSDSSIKVRKAALSRIDDTHQLHQIAEQNDQTEVKKLARKKWTHLMAKSKNTDAIKNLNDNEALLYLAGQSQHSKMRLQAVSQINQQGTLGDLLLNEKDREVQQAILEKITQESTLQRISKPLKKKNKSLYQSIQSRLNQGEDLNQNNSLALKICKQLEAVVHHKATCDLESISSQWQAIEKNCDATFKQRYNGAFAAAKMILDPEHRDSFLNKQKEQRAKSQLSEVINASDKLTDLDLSQIQSQLTKCQTIDTSVLSSEDKNQLSSAIDAFAAKRDEKMQQQQVPESATKAYDELQKVLAQEIVQPNQLKQFKTRWQQATRGAHPSSSLKLLSDQYDSGILKLAEKVEQSAQKRDEAAQQLIDMIDKAQTEIKDGHLSKAKIITNQMAALKRTAGFKHPLVQKNKYNIDNVWTQLKELRQWQKWSNDKVRQDIIDELVALVGTATHPDAVLKKLKDSNERWYALEDMEKLEGDKFPSRNQKMWQDFRTVSKALFEPTQPFFEKRSESQNSHLDEIKACIDEMLQVELESSNERDLARMTRNAIKHLKSLDQIPPKQRGQMAKKLRKGIDRIDGQLSTWYDAAETKKRALIDQAMALHDEEDLAAAIEQAKGLQAQWKKAGIVKQYTERKLWKQFRKANDALFNKRDDASKAQNEAQAAHKKAAQSALDKFNKDLKKTKDSNEIKQLKNNLIHTWQAEFQDIKQLSSNYQAALSSADDALNKQQSAKVLSSLDALKQFDVTCQSEDSDAIETALSTCSDSEKAAFLARKENVADDQHCDELLLQAEFLTGKETPKAHMEARMAYQVKVLSERMAGEKVAGESEQALALLKSWYLSAKSNSYIKNNKKRINSNIKALEALL